MRHLPIALFACALVACEAPSHDPKLGESEPPPELGVADFDWDGAGSRDHRDAPSGLSFAVPATGHRVTATQFDRSTPPIKLKHELRIEHERREIVRLDVWYDSEALGLTGFFDKYLRFMASRDALVERARAGRSASDSIVVEHPRSEQSPAQRAALVELGGRIVRVTCTNADDRHSRAVFDRVLADLRVERER